MGFHDFLESQRRPAPQVEPDFEPEVEENYEERAPQRRPRVEESSRYDSEDEKVLDEVDFYKQRLYKKIDSCFIRYGLAGLKKIDEGIADSLARYIDSLKGGTNYEDRMANRFGQNYRRPTERVRYRDDDLDEGEEGLPRRPDPEPKPAPKPFKKPVKIEGSNPNPASARRPGEPKLESGAFNPDLLNAILTDVIPPTEIHPVEIHSNIPIPEKQQAAPQKVDFAPLPEEMQEQEQPKEEIYEQAEESYQAPEAATTSNFDIADVMLAGARDTDVSLIVPPTIEEETAENYTSDADLDSPIVESETQTPIEMPKQKRKRKK